MSIKQIKIQEPTLESLFETVSEHQNPIGGKIGVWNEFSNMEIEFKFLLGTLHEIYANLSYIDTKTAQLFFDDKPKSVYIRSGGIDGDFTLATSYRSPPQANSEHQRARIARISSAIDADTLQGIDIETMISWQEVVAKEGAMIMYSNDGSGFSLGSRLQSDYRFGNTYGLTINSINTPKNAFEKVERILTHQGCNLASASWLSDRGDVRYVFDQKEIVMYR